LQVIRNLADRIMIKVTKQQKLESFTDQGEKTHFTQQKRGQLLYIEIRILDLMIAVSQIGLYYTKITDKIVRSTTK
jgi:hypothetical protein